MTPDYADDIWFPSTLEQQVAILEAHPETAMVYGPIQWWYSWTGRPEDGRRDYIERLGVPLDAVVQPPALLPMCWRRRCRWCGNRSRGSQWCGRGKSGIVP